MLNLIQTSSKECGNSSMHAGSFSMNEKHISCVKVLAQPALHLLLLLFLSSGAHGG